MTENQMQPPSPVEEGKSQVAGPGRQEMKTSTKLGMMAFAGTVALAAVWLNASLSAHKKPVAAQNTATGGTSEEYTPPPSVAANTNGSGLPTPASTPAPSMFMSNQPTPASAPIFAFSGQVAPASAAAAPGDAGAPGGPPSAMPVAATSDSSPLGDKLKATPLDGEQAVMLPHPDFQITQGTVIPCSLQTAINSELPGLVTCVVPLDIRGTTGNVVLLDRGTKIVGQIQHGLLQGQNRVFVDWTRAETPEHVLITLDSPGSDELGRSGLPGAVDNHFWERFGGALMLTLVQGGLEVGAMEAAGGNSSSSQSGVATALVDTAQSNGQEVANTALQNSINIPPTLTKNQGDTVSLIVAHDLDFSDVYKLNVNSMGVNSGG